MILAAMIMIQPASSAWVNVTGALAGKSCACGGVYCMTGVPGKDKVIIGICGNLGLFETTDNGTSWQAMGTSTGWVDPQQIVFDKDNADIFWETGIHGGTLHKTTDGGKTFSVLPGVSGGDGVWVDMNDAERKTLVYGAHEGISLMKSLDGGNTWTSIAAGISSWTNFPVVFSPSIYVVGSANGGIYRTTDAGSAWTKVSSVSAAWDPLVASNGAVYFTAAGNQAILRTTNQGATWTSMTKPGASANQYTPVEMPDGSIVAIGSTSLVQCSNGSSWTAITGGLPSAPGKTMGNLAYNSVAKSFYIAFWDCGSTVPSNAIWKLDYSASVSIDKKQSSFSRSSASSQNIIIVGGQQSASNVTALSRLYDFSGKKISPTIQKAKGVVIISNHR
jgi:photosystem II stability/assembly factor-like uncharacterized protein